MGNRIEVMLQGDNYTEQDALSMKAEMIAYAHAKGLHGSIIIVEPLL